ncbi:MAG: ABC transporter ATP-binding protein [Clostridia bacterium]|nr:ABC transporter ATP-binding protein [Clostridia bacterium]
MNAAEVRGLCKRYESFELKDVSFTIPAGSITGFIGRNGAGKTTTLKCMLGIAHADAGSVSFFSQPYAADERGLKNRIGLVLGGVGFYPSRKLRLITDVTRRFYPNWDEARYDMYMKRFGLDDRKTPAQLSNGMKVKYSLALALSHGAELLLLDEPTSGLDPISRDEILDIFLDLQDEGATILFSTHITSDLDRCADDIIYIKGGEIAASSTRHEFVSRFRAVKLTHAEYDECDRGLLIGCKRSKDGYNALITAQNEELLPYRTAEADLETVMIHLEKEAHDDTADA